MYDAILQDIQEAQFRQVSQVGRFFQFDYIRTDLVVLGVGVAFCGISRLVGACLWEEEGH